MEENILGALDRGDPDLFQLASDTLVPHVTSWILVLLRGQVHVSLVRLPLTAA